MIISRGVLVALIIESWHYRRVNAKAQWLACATAVCTGARTGGKGARAATFCTSALGNIMFIGIEALMMLMPMCCCQRAKQYCSMNSTCCTGSTRVTTLTCIQVLLSCTGGRRSWALVFLHSSIIPWSPAAILPRRGHTDGNVPPGLALPGQGRGLVHTRFLRHVCYNGLTHSSRGSANTSSFLCTARSTFWGIGNKYS